MEQELQASNGLSKVSGYTYPDSLLWPLPGTLCPFPMGVSLTPFKYPRALAADFPCHRQPMIESQEEALIPFMTWSPESYRLELLRAEDVSQVVGYLPGLYGNL